MRNIEREAGFRAAMLMDPASLEKTETTAVRGGLEVPASNHDLIDVLGVPFRRLTTAFFLEWLDETVDEHRGAYVCAVNASCVVMAGRDEAFLDALKNADVNLPDGAPVAWAVSRLSRTNQDRMPGPGMMLEVLRYAQERGRRVLLYGSTEDVLARLRGRLLADYPELDLADAISPPFRLLSPVEDSELCQRVRAARPDIVFVGLGAPKQEVWMQTHRDEVGAVLIGVGAAFDFHAGVVKRAPELLQRAGLEWAYRIAQEPRRLWKRYATTLPVFAWRIVGQIVRDRRRGS